MTPESVELELRLLNDLPPDATFALQRIEADVKRRIDRPASRLRRLALATPARILGSCFLGGLAFGATTTVALDRLGLSIRHGDGQEYLSVPTPVDGEDALLPVEDGEGRRWKRKLESGSRLLTLDEETFAPTSPGAATPRVFSVEEADGTAGDKLFRTQDGQQVLIPRPNGQER